MLLRLLPTQDPEAMETELLRALNIVKKGPITVDLNGITFLLPSVIATLVKMYKICKKNGWDFELINAKDVYHMLELLNLTKVLNITK